MTFNPNDHLMPIKHGQKEQDYLEVKWRLVWFRELCPQGTIETEEIVVDLDREVEEEVYVWNAEKRRSEKVMKRGKGYARFKATVTDGKGGKATGHKSENVIGFLDYIEKAETGAIGRALAGLGFGTQFTGDELNEGPRLVDSPVERNTTHDQGQGQEEQREERRGSASSSSSPTTVNTSKSPATTRTQGALQPSSSSKKVSTPPAPPTTTNEAAITEQQVASIEKLCEHLDKPAPSDLHTMDYTAAKELIGTLAKAYRESRIQEANTQATIILKPKEDEGVTTDPEDGEPVTPQEITAALTIHFDALGKYAYAEAKKESGVGEIKTKGDLKRVLFFCLKWENNGEFEEWKTRSILPAQVEEINGYCTPSSFGNVSVQRLQDRMPTLKGKARAQFTREEADEFLNQLREKEPLYAVACYYDPDFAYLKRHFFGLAHPLDWACADPRDESREGRYEGYVGYLMTKIEQGGGIPRPLKKYTKAIGEMQDLVKIAQAA